MSLITVSRTYHSSILILIVFGFVVILFSGYHSVNGPGSHGVSNHLDNFTCLFIICVALTLFSTLLIVLPVTKVIPELIPSLRRIPPFLLEKPPRGSA